MCEIYNDEPSKVWSERERTARKPHVCHCCGGAIAPGERYTAIFWVGDGVGYEKECAPCSAMAAEFKRVHGMRWTPSHMSHALVECIDEEGDDSEAGRKWTAAMDEMQARQDARRKAAT
jgi:hypothetical protein